MRFRSLLLLLPALLLAACGHLPTTTVHAPAPYLSPAEPAPPPATLVPPSPGGGTRGFTPGGSADNLWLVSRFEPVDGWLADYPEFAGNGVDYGRELTNRVTARIRQTYDHVYQVNRRLSQAQINQLVSQGLRYHLTGHLVKLGSEDRVEDGFTYRYGYLAVNYQLARRSGDLMRVVREDQFKQETRIADRLQPRHLDVLLDRLADRIAGQVVESTFSTLTYVAPEPTRPETAPPVLIAAWTPLP